MNLKSTTDRNGGNKDDISAENNENNDLKPEDSSEPQASFVDLLV